MFFIWLIQETFGFYANDTKKFFINNSIQKYYRTDLKWTAIFTETIRALTTSGGLFNTPYWVIRDIFLSSIVIYVCNFVDYGRDKKNNVLPLTFFICALTVDRPVIIACLAGYMMGYYKEQVIKLTENKLLFFSVTIASYAFVMLMMKLKILPTEFDKIFLYFLVWCAILAYINQSAKLAVFFSSKIFLQMGKISFGVYSFHWPVICSIGSWMLIYGLEN